MQPNQKLEVFEQLLSDASSVNVSSKEMYLRKIREALKNASLKDLINYQYIAFHKGDLDLCSHLIEIIHEKGYSQRSVL